MKPLERVLDAIDEVLNMDPLQLVANKKQFDFRYLREAREIVAQELSKVNSKPTPAIAQGILFARKKGCSYCNDKGFVLIGSDECRCPHCNLPVVQHFERVNPGEQTVDQYDRSWHIYGHPERANPSEQTEKQCSCEYVLGEYGGRIPNNDCPVHKKP